MNEEYIANAERRHKIADDMAWSSGYAAGRAAGRAAEREARADTAAPHSPYECAIEHRRQSSMGAHLYDDNCRLCRIARADTAALEATVACEAWEDNVAGDFAGPCRLPAGHDGGHDPFGDDEMKHARAKEAAWAAAAYRAAAALPEKPGRVNPMYAALAAEVAAETAEGADDD